MEPTDVKLEQSDDVKSDIKETKMKVAVIGAGISGLIAIKHCVQEGYECEAFEQTEFIGGIWNYTDEVGLDKNGLPVHTSMYKNLRTNIPKEVMTFENFPYSEDVKKSYISQTEVLDYIRSYADKMGLEKHIKILTKVVHVEPNENNKWDVKILNVPTKTTEVKQFDAVVVCNGKYETPHLPKIQGLETFPGNYIHSHDFRCVDPYKNKTVLIIGGGASGCDISNHLHPVARKVFLSFKVIPSDFNVPNGPIGRPVVSKIDGNIVQFEDGTEEKIDEIILCTGYLYSFPFLSEKCKVVVDDNYIRGLYKECLCIEYPTIAFLALPGMVCPIPTSEMQMRFFMAVLKNQFKLPSKSDMIKETEDRRSAKDCSNRRYHKKTVVAEREYWDELSEIANVRNVPNVITGLHEYVFANKRNVNHNFRIINDEEFERIS